MRRPALLLPLIPAVVLALSACDPSHAGAAATVGDHRFDLGDFTTAVTAGLAHYTGDSTGAKQTAPDFQRSLLGRQIRNQLDADLARELGIRVSDAAVHEQITRLEQSNGGHAALVAQAASQGVGSAEIFSVVRDDLLRTAISADLLKASPPTEQTIQAYYAANASQFASDHVAHILVKDKALADQIFAMVKADPTQFAALAKKYSIDTSNKDTGGDLGNQAKGAFVAAFDDAIFAAKPGDYLEVHSQFGWHIIHVIDVQNLTLAQARSQILQTLSQPAGPYVESLYGERLTAVAKRVTVHVSSRFGVWDPKRVDVVASGSDAKTALSTTGKNDTPVPTTPDLTGTTATTP